MLLAHPITSHVFQCLILFYVAEMYCFDLMCDILMSHQCLKDFCRLICTHFVYRKAGHEISLAENLSQACIKYMTDDKSLLLDLPCAEISVGFFKISVVHFHPAEYFGSGFLCDFHQGKIKSFM